MKICYFGIYDSSFSRSRVYISGLKQQGVNVIECFDRAPGVKKYLNLVRKHWHIRKKYDVLIVGYPGYTVVWLAWLISRKPIVFDALCTLYEAQVLSRGIYPLWSIRRILTYIYDHSSVFLASVTLVETVAQKEYFTARFGRHNDIRVVLTGADDKLFFPVDVKKYDRYTVLFRGRFLPEAGLRYIVEAAKLLENDNVDFRIIGSGHAENEFNEAMGQYKPNNVVVDSRYLSYEDLRVAMSQCHVSLGQLASHERLQRTIPHKAFETLALRLPYVTARAGGHHGFLKDGSNCILVNPADAQDIVRAIIYLKNNPDKAEEIALQGYNDYMRAASPKVLGEQLFEICKELV